MKQRGRRGIRSPADCWFFEFWNLSRSCSRPSWKGLVATVPNPHSRTSRAVNLSCYSSGTLGSSPARLSIAGALNFVEGKRNIVGVPLDANPRAAHAGSGKPENLMVRSSGQLSGLARTSELRL